MEWKENECAPQRQNNWAFKILLHNRKTMDFHSFFTGCITALQQPCLQFILVLPPKINGTHRPPKYTYCMSPIFFLKRLHIEKKMHIIEQWIAVIDLPNPFFSSQNSFGPPIVGMKAVNLEDATLKLFPLCQHPTQKPVIRKAPKYS